MRGKNSLPTNLCRRFYVLDLMALVAGTAGGLALAKVCWEVTANARYHQGSALAVITPSDILDWPLDVSVPFFAAGAWPIMSAWTLTLLALRLGRCSTEPSGLMKQPGMAASVAAASIITLMSILLPLCFWFQGYGGEMLVARAATRLTYDLPPLVGASVLGAWLTLVWSDRFRLELSGVHWTERIVEAGWIVLAVFALWVKHGPDW